MKDEAGRFKITGKTEGFEVSFICVYAPPGSDWTFYKSIFELMVKYQGLLICEGDFNLRLNNCLDSSNLNVQNKLLVKRINGLMAEFGIVDVWRILHANSGIYTHFSH